MEYVAQYIVKHNGYRDNEIAQLNEKIRQLEQNLQNSIATLRELGFVKCSVCQTDVHNYDSCEMCEAKKCETCTDIVHINSWNLSGMNMCFICRNTHCNHCLQQSVMETSRYCADCQDFA